MSYPTKITDLDALYRINHVQCKSKVPQFCLSYISAIFGAILIKFAITMVIVASNKKIMPAHIENLCHDHYLQE